MIWLIACPMLAVGSLLYVFYLPGDRRLEGNLVAVVHRSTQV